LELIGRPVEYNLHFSQEGFEGFHQSKASLEVIRIAYCARVGNAIIKILADKFGKSLKEFSVVRNYYEKCAKISDEGIESLKVCPNLEKLNINYSRKLRDQFHIHISSYLHNLKYLGLKNCTIQEDLSVLAGKCPLLEEIDISGDSWVTT